MHIPRPTHLLATLLLFPVPFLPAQSLADPSGHWEGSIQAPDRDVKIEVDLAKNSKNELAGTISIPAQQLKGLSLSHLAGEGNSVVFQMKGASGERKFSGAVSADGKSISGDYTQLGHSMPFCLTRTGEPRIEAPVRSAPVGKELEGDWNGALVVNGKQRRFVLKLSNQADGTAGGNIFSVDEGLEIPIAAITQRAYSLTLDVKAVGGSYSGVLNEQGTELAGTWSQGSLTLPMTFRRAMAPEGKR